MNLGLLSDIHGNRIALEAVLADGKAEGVEAWWAVGDLAALGPDPAPTLELLSNLPQLRVSRGNTDRYVAGRDRPPPSREEVLARPELFDLFAAVESSFSWTRGAAASHGWLDWLTDLPLELRTTLPDGARLLAVHAAPGLDDGPGITPDQSEESLRAALAGADADLVFVGHTHRPTDRSVGSMRAVNLGSVSNPVTEDLRAMYVIVRADRHGHAIEHRRVSYDHEAVLERIARSGHPDPAFLAAFQRGDHKNVPARRVSRRYAPAG